MEIWGEEYAYFVCLVSWSIFGFREYLLKKGGGILTEYVYKREVFWGSVFIIGSILKG